MLRDIAELDQSVQAAPRDGGVEPGHRRDLAQLHFGPALVERAQHRGPRSSVERYSLVRAFRGFASSAIRPQL